MKIVGLAITSVVSMVLLPVAKLAPEWCPFFAFLMGLGSVHLE